jgi:hypothetical protein
MAEQQYALTTRPTRRLTSCTFKRSPASSASAKLRDDAEHPKNVVLVATQHAASAVLGANKLNCHLCPSFPCARAIAAAMVNSKRRHAFTSCQHTNPWTGRWRVKLMPRRRRGQNVDVALGPLYPETRRTAWVCLVPATDVSRCNKVHEQKRLARSPRWPGPVATEEL